MLNLVTEEESSSKAVYCAVASEDLAYTVFLKDMKELVGSDSLQPSTQNTSANNGLMGWISSYVSVDKWLYYPPVVSKSDNGSTKSMFVIQKLYLKHSEYARLDGPYYVDKEIDCMCISLDGNHVGFSYYGGKCIAVYNVVNGKTKVFYRGSANAVIKSLFISNDNRYITCTSNRGTVHIFDTSNESSVVEPPSLLSKKGIAQTTGYYPKSFVQIESRDGWEALITGTCRGGNSRLVLVSTSGCETWKYDAYGKKELLSI